MSSSLWSRIELAIGHKGWDPAELSRQAVVSRSALSNIKSGLSQGGKVYGKLAVALEVDPEWLRSGDNRVRPGWLNLEMGYDLLRKPGEKSFRELNEQAQERMRAAGRASEAETPYDLGQARHRETMDELKLQTELLKKILDRLSDPGQSNDELVRAALAARMPGKTESLLKDKPVKV